MEKLVIDANVVISALIKKGFAFDLIVALSRVGIKLLSPDFLWEEVEKKKGRILKYSKLEENELDFLIKFLFKRIEVVPKEEYEEFIPKAEELLKEHKKDVPYVALALRFGCGIWSNEKRLAKLEEVKVFSTHELRKLFLI